ncbi:MAG: FkbM family methyltransferase [Hyphomicrobiaceae bacterium]
MKNLGSVPVLRRWVQSAGRRYFAARGIRFVVKKRLGATFLLDVHSQVDRHLLYFNDWESEQRTFLHEAFADNPPDLVFDIGSYFGVYAITLARLWPASAVIAFEPQPDNFRQLSANILLNATDNCTAHNVALGSQTGTATMSGSARNRGESRLGAAGTEVEVKVRALDDLYDVTGQRLCLKIDVEGHERQAIAGMRTLLQNNAVTAQIEIFDENRTAVIGDLEKLGLRQIHRIEHDLYFTNT